MNSPLADALGIDPDIMHWVIIPLAIFLARIVDVSINTLRTVLMLGGRKRLAPVFGFFESFIWLVAIGQIMKNLDSVTSYFAYAGGFASGIYVGMLLEEKLAFGKVIVRLITSKNAAQLIEVLKREGYSLTIVDGKGGRGGKVNLIFSVLQRSELPKFKRLMNQWDPGTFYSIEAVRYASEPMYNTDVDELGASGEQAAIESNNSPHA